MGNSAGNTDEKSTKTGQNENAIKDVRIWRAKKKKTTEIKITIQLEGMKQSPSERRKVKEISTKVKRYTKQDIPKQRKNILSTTGNRWHEAIPTTRCKRNRTLLD